MTDSKSEPLSAIVFEETAFLALRVPDVCRAGVIANLALLNDHATCLDGALAKDKGEDI